VLELGVDGTIIGKEILKKYGRALNGFIWLRIGAVVNKFMNYRLP